jgi:hypothetical protein
MNINLITGPIICEAVKCMTCIHVRTHTNMRMNMNAHRMYRRSFQDFLISMYSSGICRHHYNLRSVVARNK